MRNALLILLALLVLGAIAKGGTLLHSFAVAFDAFCQDLLWNDTLGVTISSRAGLAARRGVLWPARAIDLLMFNRNHCEQAIAADIQRAQAALAILTGKES